MYHFRGLGLSLVVLLGSVIWANSVNATHIEFLQFQRNDSTAPLYCPWCSFLIQLKETNGRYSVNKVSGANYFDTSAVTIQQKKLQKSLTWFF
jgi:hypothetical protein